MRGRRKTERKLRRLQRPRPKAQRTVEARPATELRKLHRYPRWT